VRRRRAEAEGDIAWLSACIFGKKQTAANARQLAGGVTSKRDLSGTGISLGARQLSMIARTLLRSWRGGAARFLLVQLGDGSA